MRVEGSDGSNLEQSPGIVNEVGWVSLLGMMGSEHSYMDWIKDLEPQHIGPLSDINSLDEVSSYSVLYFPG